jgi:hypothetical protein
MLFFSKSKELFENSEMNIKFSSFPKLWGICGETKKPNRYLSTIWPLKK